MNHVRTPIVLLLKKCIPIKMCIISQALSTEELDKIKEDLVEHFNSDESIACGIKSLYFELIVKR